MSGTLFSLISAFIIIVLAGYLRHESYLLTKNAVYGIECTEIAKSIGFKDGDKIISVNGKEIERFDQIIPTIVAEPVEVAVKIRRGQEEKDIMIFGDQKYLISVYKNGQMFSPRLSDDSNKKTGIKPLEYGTVHHGFNESAKLYFDNFLMVKKIINLFVPKKNKFQDIGGFQNINPGDGTVVGSFYLLASFLVLISLINLLPFPGFDLGNTIIALVEKSRKKTFDTRTMRWLRIICIILFVTLAVVKM